MQVVTAERDKLRKDYELLRMELALLQKRIFAARAERIDTKQLEMEFAAKRAQLLSLTKDVEEPAGEHTSKTKKKPHGRRDLSLSSLPQERCEIRDPESELAGRECIGFEESTRLGYKRGGAICIIVARAKYKIAEQGGSIATAALPKEIVARSLCAPSMMAKVLVDKFAYGLPFFRQEERMQCEGISLDRSVMSRVAEEVGMTLGCIVLAARDHAIKHAFCLATDATGVAIQPTRIEEGPRQACRKGHFFVTLADRDHVFFSFEPKHTSQAVAAMFAGYTGYIQADASAVYDALFRVKPKEGEDEPPDKPSEVGCFAHARRKFYEAAITTRDPRAREGLMRIRLLFEKEAEWAKLAPTKRGILRRSVFGVWLTDFFAWARDVYKNVQHARGPLASAFGYVVRQEAPLSKFLEDGRLRIDNNASERALRTVAIGRKNWLFFGSDDHAEAAANVMSLIASCKLHAIEPSAYLEAVIRCVPVWPRDRYIELAPCNWLATRARLDSTELDAPFGHVTVPPPKE